jgi:hypothetical protein
LEGLERMEGRERMDEVHSDPEIAADPTHAPDAAQARTQGRSQPPAPERQRASAQAWLNVNRSQTLFTRLKWTSFTHSCIYLALLVCAFAIGKPQPETFVLGLSHGVLWICMSLACIAAARLRIVSMRLAVAVAVLGGIGPFFGSWEFMREQRRPRTLE